MCALLPSLRPKANHELHPPKSGKSESGPAFAKGEARMIMEPGHCPQCGRYCGNIVGFFEHGGLVKVVGICVKHGEVDLTEQDWDATDFEGANEGARP